MKFADWAIPLLVLMLFGFTACGAEPPAVSPIPTSTLLPSPAPTSAPTPTHEIAPTLASPEFSTPTPTISTPVNTSAPIISLVLSAEQRLTPGSEILLEVRLDPKGRGISGVQFDLEVSPAPLEVLGITPGPFLGPDPVVIRTTGAAPGSTLYAAARKGLTQGPAPSGTVAVVQLRLPSEATPGAPVRVGLQKVKIADEAIRQIGGVIVTAPVELVVANP